MSVMMVQWVPHSSNAKGVCVLIQTARQQRGAFSSEYWYGGLRTYLVLVPIIPVPIIPYMYLSDH